MCPGYKWPLLLRRKKSRDVLSEVTVLEVTPWEVSFVPFLHNANLNPENSPIWTVFSLSCSRAVGARAVPPAGTMHGDGCQRCSGKLQTISHPTPSSTEVPSGEDTAGGPCPSGDVRRTEQSRSGKCPPCILWWLFAPSGLSSHSDLRGCGYKIMDLTPFSLHRAGGKAEARGECHQSAIAFGLFSVG